MVTAKARWLRVPILSSGLGLGLSGLVLLRIAARSEPSVIAPLDPEKPSTHNSIHRLLPYLAQLDPAAPQGETVVIGDTSVPVPWQRQGDRIGLADIPLTRHLGVDLRSTNVVGQQPILWFTEAPQTLPTWLGNGYRYIDITDWATQQGWQLQSFGSQLRIQASAGTVSTGRRGRQPWGDRLVLELDQPTLWTLVETPTSFTFTLQAQTSPSFDTAALTSGTGNVLQTLQVQTSGDALRIQGTFDGSARPRIWSLINPHRVVLDFTQADVEPRDILWAPGLRWREMYVRVGDRPFPVHQLWLDPGQGVTLRPIWPNPEQMTGIEPLATTAQRWGAIAAINAGFFNRNNQLPLGVVRSEGQWISGPILNRGAIGWNSQGNALISRLFLNHILTTDAGSTFPITQINSGYPEAGIALYTNAWGDTYSPITDNEILISVDQNQTVSQQLPVGTAGIGTYPIPADGYLLTARSYQEAARSLSPGTTLTLAPDIRPAAFGELPNMVGGGPLLVQAGRMVLDPEVEQFSDAFATQAAPRSAIGVTPNGQIVLAAIHNSPGGRGPTLQETAQIMMQLGVQDALNLDGGNSASLYLGGSIINRHPSTVGRVHNGLGVFLESE
ncbi:MAG: phosphodiester glycosidase family protein [Cyanobacteria bacterium J06626_18]